MPQRVLVVCSLLLATASAAAQLRFSQDAKGAFREAREQGRPLLIYLNSKPGVSSARRLRESRVFRDPTVVRLGKLFVCLEVRPAQHREQLVTWGLQPQTDRYVVFAAPDRQRLHATSVGEVIEFVDHLVTARRAYGQFLWETELGEQLESPRASPEQLRAVLDRIVRYEVRAADYALARFVRRDGLTPDLRKAAWEALAGLSTRPAVVALADHARHDPEARAALQACTPVAAEFLSHWLGQGPPVRDHAIYVALCKVAKVRPRRREAFWVDENPDVIRSEISWIRAKVTARAMEAYTAPE